MPATPANTVTYYECEPKKKFAYEWITQLRTSWVDELIEQNSTIEKRIIPDSFEDQEENFDTNFQELKIAIQESNSILELKDDWDDDGAMPVNKLAYEAAIGLLKNYSTSVHKLYGIKINTPNINAGRYGEVDLHWKKQNAELLITVFNAPELTIHYYGDDKNNNTIIKGDLKSINVNEDLLHWMRKL